MKRVEKRMRWLWVRDIGPLHPKTEWVANTSNYYGDGKDPFYPLILKTERLIAYGVRVHGRITEVRFLVREDLLDSLAAHLLSL